MYLEKRKFPLLSDGVVMWTQVVTLSSSCSLQGSVTMFKIQLRPPGCLESLLV